MAKVQTRKSISVRGVTYNRLFNHCRRLGVSMSDVVERLLEHHLGPMEMTLKPPSEIPDSRNKPHYRAKKPPSWGTAVMKPRAEGPVEPMAVFSKATPGGSSGRPRPAPAKVSKAPRAGEGVRW